MDYRDIAGADLVAAGLADQAAGRTSEAALLVAIGRPRLVRLGLSVAPMEEPELKLYRLLSEQDPKTAARRYNALLGRLVSFERGLERRVAYGSGR